LGERGALSVTTSASLRTMAKQTGSIKTVLNIRPAFSSRAGALLELR
jgi:hypothetical protein